MKTEKFDTQETVDAPIEQEAPASRETSLKNFSKRYSSAGRANLAMQIHELRFQHAKKEKDNSQKVESAQEQQKQVEALALERQQIEEEIQQLQEEVSEHKAKVWIKVTELFKKTALEQELQIDIKNKKLEEIKKGIEERLKIIAGIQKVIVESSELDDAKDALQEFYGKQFDIRSSFEVEEKQRDVETLAKENGYMFLHAIPTKKQRTGTTVENNPIVKTGNMTTDDKLSILIGLEPTISTSVAKEGSADIKTLYPFGAILGGGKVLSAYNEDGLTVAEGLYSRRSKYDTDNTTIQGNIVDRLHEAAEIKSQDRKTHEHNEVVIEDPKVVGLFINSSQVYDTGQISPAELKKYVEDFAVPMYAIKNGKFYPIDFNKENIFDTEGPVSLEQVLAEKKVVSPEERVSLATTVIEKNPFQIDSTVQTLLKSYIQGKQGYTRVLEEQRLHTERNTFGISGSKPTTPKLFLEKTADKLAKFQKIVENGSESYKQKKFIDRDRENLLLSTYGFAVNAQEHGDEEIYKQAEEIITTFGSLEECQKLVEGRVFDEQGNFKLEDRDVPIEIRAKLAELRQ